MDFNGANISEVININANGGRVLFSRNVDLSGTDVTTVRLDLSVDGQSDTVVVDATSGDDVIVLVGDGGIVRVLGLSAVVEILNFEAIDRLVINTLAGGDVLDATGFGFGITGDGGEGDDVLLGGDGDDILLGGLGDDVLIGGLGANALDGGAGDNILI